MNYHKAAAVTCPPVSLAYDPVIRKTKIKTDEKPSATGDQAHILGASLGATAKKSPFEAGITGGFNLLYLCTDLLDHQPVGDFVVPLLHRVPTSKNK